MRMTGARGSALILAQARIATARCWRRDKIPLLLARNASATSGPAVLPSTSMTCGAHRLRVRPVAALTILIPILGAASNNSPAPTGLAAIRVPPGFRVEKVAGANLLSYPMMGTIDERGRLFICESSGNTLTTDQMTAKPDYVVRMLEDTNGDSVY